MAATKTYTLEVVKQHNTPDDLWLVIEGKVYDVTKFRNEHPGGEDTLDEVAGRDATRDFLDVGHSQEARQILKKYYIGDLEGSNSESELPVSTPSAPPLLPPTPTAPLPSQPTIGMAETTITTTAVPPPEKQCCAVA